MGCDIHLYVERREGGQWFSADQWTPNKWYDKGEEGSRPLTVEYENRFYTGRNYGLFSILANVRNDSGFVPIAQPRGLPSDVSDEVRGESKGWGSDGHSHSWLTVAELDAYNWAQGVTRQGCVDAENYMLWRDTGKPRQWSGSVGGGVVSLATHSSFEDSIRFGFADRTYTLVTWTEPTDRVVSQFLEKTMPRLRALGPAEDVRIVFWFDN